MEIELLRLEIQNVASLCIHCLQNVQKLWYSTDKTSIEKILSVKILYPSLEAGISEADISIRAIQLSTSYLYIMVVSQDEHETVSLSS